MSLPTDISFLKENIVLIAAVVFLAAMTLYGHYRGFIRMAVSLGAAIFSFYLVRIILPGMLAALKGSAFFEEQTDRLTDYLFSEISMSQYSEIYSLLGLDKAAEAAGEHIAQLLLNVICFLVLFLVINLLLKLLAHFLNTLVKLPILHGTNQILGTALGFLEAVFYLWIFMIGIAVTPSAAFSRFVLQQIMESQVLLWFYHNNFLLGMIAAMLGAQ